MPYRKIPSPRFFTHGPSNSVRTQNMGLSISRYDPCIWLMNSNYQVTVSDILNSCRIKNCHPAAGLALYLQFYHNSSTLYNVYIGGCSVHRGDIMMHVGDTMSTLGDCSVHREDTMSTLGDIMSTLGGYNEYIGGCSVRQGFQ